MTVSLYYHKVPARLQTLSNNSVPPPPPRTSHLSSTPAVPNHNTNNKHSGEHFTTPSRMFLWPTRPPAQPVHPPCLAARHLRARIAGKDLSHRFSPSPKSLHATSLLPRLQVFNLIHSLPLFADLAVRPGWCALTALEYIDVAGELRVRFIPLLSYVISFAKSAQNQLKTIVSALIHKTTCGVMQQHTPDNAVGHVQRVYCSCKW